MKGTLRISGRRHDLEFVGDVVFENNIATFCEYSVIDFEGWPKWKLLKHCAEQGWNHSVVNELPKIIQSMNKLIPEGFALKLDSSRPRLAYQAKDPKEWDLVKILDLLLESKLPIIYHSGLCGIGERLYVHITCLANAKHWNFAFVVRNKSIVNCMACVTPGGKEWNIDDDDTINMIPLGKWQKLTEMLLVEKKRRILAIPVWKVCIEVTPGGEEWTGYGPMYDKSPGVTGKTYPAALKGSIYFDDQKEAEEVATKAQAYFDDLTLKESKKKK